VREELAHVHASKRGTDACACACACESACACASVCACILCNRVRLQVARGGAERWSGEMVIVPFLHCLTDDDCNPPALSFLLSARVMQNWRT
jgi:hypothetical protein